MFGGLLRPGTCVSIWGFGDEALRKMMDGAMAVSGQEVGYSD